MEAVWGTARRLAADNTRTAALCNVGRSNREMFLPVVPSNLSLLSRLAGYALQE
jgi:hypothetical protein